MQSKTSGLLLAGLLTAPAMGEIQIDVELMLGGENHAEQIHQTGIPVAYDTSWAVTDDSTVFTCGELLNWAVAVTVSGTNGDVCNGVAHLVVDLELLKDGQLVYPAKADPGCHLGGWCSTMNTGVLNSPAGRGSLQLAAFAYSVDSGAIAPIVDPVNGLDSRPFITGSLIDDVAADGAGMQDATYPSTYGFPPSSISPIGVLEGMGAGFSSFSIPSFDRTPNTIIDGNLAGVGCVGSYQNTTCGVPSSLPVGNGPFLEGQIYLKGMSSGVYELKVTASADANSVLLGDFNPLSIGGDLTSLPTYAQPVTIGGSDSIGFTIDCPPPVHLTYAASRKLHSGLDCHDEYDVELYPNPEGTAGAGVECRSDGTIDRLVLEFDSPVSLDCSNIMINRGREVCAGVTDLGGNAYEVALVGGMNETCLEVELLGIPYLEGTRIFQGLNLLGDVNASGGVTIIDLANAKSCMGTPIGAGFCTRADTNRNCNISVIDLSNIKAEVGSTASCWR